MKINTNTILLLAVAALGVYLLTRPKPLPAPVYNPYPAGYNPYATQPAQSTTAQDIAAGGQAATGLASALSNLFNG